MYEWKAEESREEEEPFPCFESADSEFADEYRGFLVGCGQWGIIVGNRGVSEPLFDCRVLDEQYGLGLQLRLLGPVKDQDAVETSMEFLINERRERLFRGRNLRDIGEVFVNRNFKFYASNR